MPHPKIKICQQCHTINQPQALVCTECGHTLDAVSTLAVKALEKQPMMQHTGTIGSVPLNHVGLFFAGSSKPVIFPREKEQILGRTVPHGDAVDVDLTPYGAGVAGVSRVHAKFIFERDQVFLMDLGSSNGTAINQNRIVAHYKYSLRNGDMLTLGQLRLFVYFQSQNPTARTIYCGAMADSLPLVKNDSLPIQRLTMEVTPLIAALAHVQKTLSTARQQVFDAHINLKTIMADGDRFSITLDGLADALDYMVHDVMPIKKQIRDAVVETSIAPPRTRPAASADLPAANNLTRPLPKTDQLPPTTNSPEGEPAQPTIGSPERVRQTAHQIASAYLERQSITPENEQYHEILRQMSQTTHALLSSPLDVSYQ